jgi:hypothetical protein
VLAPNRPSDITLDVGELERIAREGAEDLALNMIKRLPIEFRDQDRALAAVKALS